MKFPDREDFPPGIRALMDMGAEWKTFADPDAIARLPANPLKIEKQKKESQVALVAYRKYAEETQAIIARVEKGDITKEIAADLLQKALDAMEVFKKNAKL